MLSLFRTNQLLFSFLLLFYAGLLHLSAYWQGAPIEPAAYGVFSALLYQWIGYQGWIPQTLTVVLLFIHGTALNGLNLRHRFIEEVNLFPGLLYVLIACLLPEFLYLSPLHLANTFYLLALVDLLAIYNRQHSAGHIFNAGLWIGLGSLFYFSAFIFIFLAFVALRILRSFDLRERLMVLLGVLTPYLLTGLYFFWFDRFDYFIGQQFGQPLSYLDFQPAPPALLTYFKLGLFAVLLSIVLFSHNRYLTKKIIQVQKKVNILFWGLLCAGLTLLFQPALQLDHLLLLGLPMGLLLAVNFTALRPTLASLIHLLLVLIALVLQYRHFLFDV